MKRERSKEPVHGRRRSRAADGRQAPLPGEKSWTEYHRGRRVAVEAAPRMRIHAERRKAAIRRAVLAVLTLVLVMGVAGGAWAMWFFNDVQSNLAAKPAEHKKITKALTKAKPKEPFTVLLLGDDRRKGETKARTDTIIIARVDPESKEVRMVSIPRDTKVQLPGYHTDKINAAGFYGGPSLVIDTVEEFLGVPINHYMMVDFKGFRQVVDAMGGVWIDVDVEIDDKKAASHGSRQAYHIDPGYQLLDGEHALTYVRSRDFPDADFTRMKHQQSFFKALAKQSLQLANVLKLPDIVRSMSKHTQTSMNPGEILVLVKAMRGIGEDNVQTATITGDWISPYVIADEDVKEHLAEALRTGADIEADVAKTPAEEVVASNVSVTVRNGAGIAGCASQASERLKTKGYQISSIGNANQFVYEKTLVIFKDQEAKARSVAAALGVAKVVESRGMYSFSTDVLVVVGKDWPLPESSSTVSRRADS